MATYSFTTSTASAVESYFPRNLVCELAPTQDANNNKTKLDWVLKAGYCSNSLNYVTFSNVKLAIAGTVVYHDASQGKNSYNSNAVIASGSITIDHEDDGSKTIAVSAEAGIYAWAVNSTYSGSITLEPIQRGLIYLDTGFGYEAYLIDVDNGANWEQCMPEIDDGVAWNVCS